MIKRKELGKEAVAVEDTWKGDLGKVFHGMKDRQTWKKDPSIYMRYKK